MLSLPLLYLLDVSHSTGGKVNVILSDRLFFQWKCVRVGQSGFVH